MKTVGPFLEDSLGRWLTKLPDGDGYQLRCKMLAIGYSGEKDGVFHIYLIADDMQRLYQELGRALGGIE